jgi:cytochrome c oxidase subunit III
VTARPVIATTALPRTPRGRSTAWAGMAVLVLIETTVVLALTASYFYLRTSALLWPPPGIDPPALGLPAAAHALITLSAAPMVVAERRFRRARAKGSERRGVRAPIAVGMGLLAAALALEVLVYRDVTYTWEDHAYGSIVWTNAGYSALHLLVVLGLAAMLFALEQRGHLRERRAAAVDAVALYWYFVAVTSPLTFATLYLSPHLL